MGLDVRIEATPVNVPRLVRGATVNPSLFSSERHRKVTYRAATLIWATIILILSLQPIRPGNIHAGVAHHIAHFLGFGALAFLATLGFGRPGRNSLQPAAASFLFGLAIEFVQHWQNQMPVEWPDVRDNAVGIGVFAAFCLVYQRKADSKEGRP